MAIEVHTTDPAVDHVELMIVKDQCTSDDCVGVAPPSSIEKPPGSVYYQIAGDRFVAPVTNDVAGFRLEPGDDDYIPRLGAIGFTAEDKPLGIGIIDTDFHIKEHLGEVFQLELAQHPIEQAEGATPFDVGADDLVVVWRAPNAPPVAQSCLAIQPRSGPATFVVPKDDPDCDGITGHDECDPFWYQYVRPATGTDQACFAQSSPTAPCILGRETTCVDGHEDQCTPGNFCVPAAACHDCSSVFDPNCLDKLAQNSDPTVAKIVCKVPVIQQAQMYSTCPGASLGTSLNALFNNQNCMPGILPRNATMPFLPQQAIGFDTGVGTATLMLIPPVSNDCLFQFTIQTALSDVPPEQVPGAVLLRGASHDVIVPLVVDFVLATQTVCTGIDTKLQCSAMAASSTADPVWTCGAH